MGSQVRSRVLSAELQTPNSGRFDDGECTPEVINFNKKRTPKAQRWVDVDRSTGKPEKQTDITMSSTLGKVNLFVLFFLVCECGLIKILVHGDCVDNNTLSLAADGYQFPHSQPGSGKFETWREWWFFTLFDSELDVGVAISYGAPANTTPVQPPGVVGMVYRNVSKGLNQAYTFTDMFSKEGDFYASTAEAKVLIGESVVTPLSDTIYVVSGASLNGEVKWFLTYTRFTYPDQQIQNEGNLIHLDWISYMPSAAVAGIIQLNGVNHTLSSRAQGYHDHNYGYWPTKFFNWVWGQFSSGSNFSLVLGAYAIPVCLLYLCI